MDIFPRVQMNSLWRSDLQRFCHGRGRTKEKKIYRQCDPRLKLFDIVYVEASASFQAAAPHLLTPGITESSIKN